MRFAPIYVFPHFGRALFDAPRRRRADIEMVAIFVSPYTVFIGWAAKLAHLVLRRAAFGVFFNERILVVRLQTHAASTMDAAHVGGIEQVQRASKVDP
jgi:hypothetical protein